LGADTGFVRKKEGNRTKEEEPTRKMTLLNWLKKKKNQDPDKPNKPSASPFMQQKMSASEFEVTASSMLPVLFFIAIVFIPMGIVFLTADSKVLEKTVEYTDCQQYACDSNYNPLSGSKSKCCHVYFELSEEYMGQAYMYYKLENFFQNHLYYIRSKDDQQLNGDISSTLSANCKDPYKTRTIQQGNTSQTFNIAPCGAIPNSLFNDTFKLVYVQVGTDIGVSLSHKDTTWPEEKNDKFRNPSLKNVENNTLQGAYKHFASPPNWQKPIYELSPYESDNNGNLNSDLIVWLRTSTFPTFRKLYRRIVHTGSHFAKGLPKGRYRMDLKYNFPVKNFKGRKFFVLTTASWLGGKNNFLGVCYIATGLICLISGFISIVFHMKSRTRTAKVSEGSIGSEPKS